MSIKNFLISCIFPKRCVICNEVIDYNAEICDSCMNDFCLNDVVQCIPYAKNNEVYKCFSPFFYRGKIREIILKFKFHNHTKCVDFFSREIVNTISLHCDLSDIDYICFVPMTEKSVSERGYNQSEILAESMGKILKIPVQETLVKTRDTFVQHRLDAKDRERNLFSAFSLSEVAAVKGKNFILCDDIVTTGNTLRECLKVLKDGGANKVVCCTIASTGGMAQ